MAGFVCTYAVSYAVKGGSSGCTEGTKQGGRRVDGVGVGAGRLSNSNHRTRVTYH